MLRLAEGTLVVLVGAAGAGKSSWAAEHFAPDQVVSADRLRAVVGESERDLAASADAFAVLDRIVEARVKRRLTTVVDTLGTDAGRRRGWRELAGRHGVGCVAVAFDVAPAQVRRQNAARPLPVPREVLNAQLAAYAQVRPQLEEEGFDLVIVAQPAGDGLRFGLQLSTFELPGGPAGLGERLGEAARAAEAAGFDSVWVMDHFRQIPQLGRPWADLPESSTTLGYLAAATRTIRLGCLVHCVTYRNLAHLAKLVATLDVLSGGRAWCGLGAGWFEAEHVAYGYRFPSAAERLDLLEDALQLLPLMWAKGSTSFRGKRIEVPETLCYPRPLSAPLPILVGGAGERRTLRLAARYADACNLTGGPEVVRHKVGVLHRHCAEAGRDPAAVRVTHLSTALVAADPAELDAELTRRRPPRQVARWNAWHNPGTVEDQLLRVRVLQAAGVQDVIVSLTGVWDSPAVERFGQVIAAAR